MGVTVRSISCSSEPARRAVERLDHLQVPQRHRVDQQRIGRAAQRQAAHVLERRLLRVAEVVHERTGRATAAAMRLEAVAVERLHAQLLDQRPPGRLRHRSVHGVDFGDREPAASARAGARRDAARSPR